VIGWIVAAGLFVALALIFGVAAQMRDNARQEINDLNARLDESFVRNDVLMTRIRAAKADLEGHNG
jgi:hypothetical protein